MAQQEVVLPSPAAVDTMELHFKLVKRCDAVHFEEKPAYANLLAVANSMGLSFIGKTDGFIVVKTNALSEDEFPRKFVPVQCRPVTHLAVNADETLLTAAGPLSSKGCVAYTYSLNSIVGDNNLVANQKVMLSSTPGVVISEMVWNPAATQLLGACLSDGSVVVVELKSSSLEINSLPTAAAARCLCWSPKGKQLVVGGEDGKLTQYRPDLKPAKALPAPPLFGGAAAVVSVLWVSNFQFAAFYRDRNQPDVSPVLVIVNAAKNEPVTFINYDDVTYGSTGFRFPQFYFYCQPAWNVILISSANSVELAVLHLTADGKTWEQWLVGDSSRAEMPLSADQEETYPVGMAVDVSSQSRVPWPQGETELPPMPRLMLLSNEGRLCLYNVVCLRPDIPTICAAPSKIVADTFFDAPPAERKPSLFATESPSTQKRDSPSMTVAPAVISAPPQVTAKPLQGLLIEPQAKASAINQATLARNEEAPPAVPRHVPVPSQKGEAPRDASPAAARAPSPVPEPPATVQEPEVEIDESVYNAAILDEVAALNEVFVSLHTELSKENSENQGSEEKFSDTVRRLEALVEFQKDVEETTGSQAEEVAELKLEVLELTAKTEDARLVSSRRGSRLSTHLRRAEQLDPVMARTLREILTLRTYIENQLTQITDHLDRQWEEHQRSCRKDAKDRMETPVMEDIFKTINLHKKLLCRQKLDLDRLQKEIEQRTSRAGWPAMVQRPVAREHDSSRSAELSKLADSLLGMTIPSDDEFKKEDVNELVIESKRKNAEAAELTVADITLLLDRFEDSEVPQVSRVLSYAEREAHKKEVAARIKNAAERIKKKEEEKTRKSLQSAPFEPSKGLVSLPSVSFEVSPASVSAAFAKSDAFVKPPSAASAFAVASLKDKQLSSATSSIGKPLFSYTSLSGEKSTPLQPTFTDFGRSYNAQVESPSFQTSDASKPLGVFGTTGLTPISPASGTKRATSSGETVVSSPVTTVSMSTTADSNGRKPVSVPASSKPAGESATEASAFSAFGSGFGAATKSITITTAPLFGIQTTSSSSLFGTSSIFGVTPSFGGSAATTPSLFAGANTTPVSFASVKPVTTSTSSAVGFSFGAALAAPPTPPSPTTSVLLRSPALTSADGATSKLVASGASDSAFVEGKLTAGKVPVAAIATSSSAKTSSPSTTVDTTAVSGETTSLASGSDSVQSKSPVSTSTGLFASVASSAQTGSIFGRSTPTVSGLFASVTSSAPVTTGSGSSGLFGTVTSSGIFGTVPVSTPTTTHTETPSESGGAVTSVPSSIFGKVPTTSISSSFVAPSTAGASPSVFATPATASSAGVFGAATSGPGLFGAPAVTTAGVGIFGASATTAANTGLFAAVTTPASPGIFGAAVTTSASPSIFGSIVTTTTTSGAFGAATSTTAGSSLFGSSAFASTPATTSSGLFGSAFSDQAPTTTSPGVFGTSTAPSTPSGFAADLNKTSNLFGQMLGGSPSPSSAPQANIFGQTTPTKSAFDSGGTIFGGSTPASTSSSIFGTPVPNVFGQAASPSLFGATTASSNVFGQTPATTASSFFGQAICSPFGSGSAAPNQSPFSGAAAATPTAFGSSAFGGKPAFGQSSFGSSGTTSIFGGSGAPSTPATGSIFGGASTGSTSFQSSGFNPGPFSGGSGTVAQTGFGASFSKPTGGGFGSAPVFGGAPAATAFGATPAFGSAPAFGTSSKVFGSSTSQAAPFGQAQQAPGFESLASQNTVGFGNLAQMSGGQQSFGAGFSSPQQSAFGSQQPQQQQQQPPSSFGGNSFSSWR